jgi:hypothetical protein
MLVALTLAVALSGCGKKSTPMAPAALDEAPPAAPSRLALGVEPDAQTALLSWLPSPSANVAHYQVYQYSPSTDRENAYVLVGQTDAAVQQYVLPYSDADSSPIYRLRAVSGTGVLSDWSAASTMVINGSGPEPETDPGDEPVMRPKH